VAKSQFGTLLVGWGRPELSAMQFFMHAAGRVLRYGH
jgi:hypothetical protein